MTESILLVFEFTSDNLEELKKIRKDLSLIFEYEAQEYFMENPPTNRTMMVGNTVNEDKKKEG